MHAPYLVKNYKTVVTGSMCAWEAMSLWRSRQTGAEPPHEILTGHSCSNMKNQSASEKPLRGPFFFTGA